jgi:hypothetical protein
LHLQLQILDFVFWLYTVGNVCGLLLLLLFLLQLPIGPIGAHLTLTNEMWNVSAACFSPCAYHLS